MSSVLKEKFADISSFCFETLLKIFCLIKKKMFPILVLFFNKKKARTCNDFTFVHFLWTITESDMIVVSEKRTKKKTCLMSLTFPFVLTANHRRPLTTEYLEISLLHNRVQSLGVPRLCTARAVAFAHTAAWLQVGKLRGKGKICQFVVNIAFDILRFLAFKPLFSDMKIASFNAQRFGLKKASDPDVISTFVKVT